MARVYLDSCLVIYLHEGTREMQERIWTRMKESAEVVFCVSDLVMLECRVGALKRHDDALLAEYDAFFDLPDIVTVPLSSAVFRLASEIRAANGLKTPDALHVTAAIQAGRNAIWTADDEFDRASGRISVKRV